MADEPGDAADPSAGAADPSAGAADPSANDDVSTAETADPADGRRRQVTVPQELFRIVVVFSTVLSILTILVGFVLLDAATRVVENPTGSVFVDLVRWVFGLSLSAVEPHLTTIALVVGLLGVGCIGLGVWVYAIGTRFRAEMGTHKNAADEDADDG